MPVDHPELGDEGTPTSADFSDPAASLRICLKRRAAIQ